MRKPAFAAILDEKFDMKIFVDAAVCFTPDRYRFVGTHERSKSASRGWYWHRMARSRLRTFTLLFPWWGNNGIPPEPARPNARPRPAASGLRVAENGIPRRLDGCWS